MKANEVSSAIFQTPEISAETLRDAFLRGERLTLIDVRSQEAFAGFHIPGSRNIPSADLDGTLALLRQEKNIITVCNRGNSSGVAADKLIENGITAKVLKGGIKAWNALYDVSEVKPLNLTRVRVFQFKRLGKGCLSYIVSFPNSDAIVIDPGQHIQVYEDYLKQHNVKPVAVLDTHIHADHLTGGIKLAERCHIPYMLPHGSRAAVSYTELQQSLPNLLSVPVAVVHTPGHTSESVSLMIDGAYLFTGDALFLETVGRSDLGQSSAGNASEQFRVITEKLFHLDSNLMVLPAHAQHSILPGEQAVAKPLAEVKRVNQINNFSSAQEFEQFVLSHPVATPPNFEMIKELNREGKSTDEPDELELGANRCAIR